MNAAAAAMKAPPTLFVAFNLSLILRNVLGAGTPRQWKDLEGPAFLLFY